MPQKTEAYSQQNRLGFTLVELLTVIAIIAVLMALLFPVMTIVMERARKMEAHDHIVLIVNAVSQYYTDYGKYPLEFTAQDVEFGKNGTPTDKLFNVLRSNSYPPADTLNPKKIVFLQVNGVKDPASPKKGIGADGKFYDPWGNEYAVKIDGNYDNRVTGPYGDPIDAPVIAWSVGKDGVAAKDGDDVISWQ